MLVVTPFVEEVLDSEQVLKVQSPGEKTEGQHLAHSGSS